ncbi:MAG: AAA family ATPase [Pedobacter sp.]
MIRNILESLLKPEAYPEPTHSVELLQTHVSWIFLTDKHAFKLKKPVNFGFLNFSTIDLRRFYCNEEVRLNRRLCPDIYEGVVELRETSGGAAFHGNGSVIDYAVKMKRLPADRMLDNLVNNNRISGAEIQEVARIIANFHLNAPTSPAIAEFGQLDRIMFNWEENFEQMIPFEETTLSEVERNRIKAWVSSFAAENADLFKRRVDEGFIRECDGDIHLENICMMDDKVYIFDCIEFNERFRYCDTVADVAFLLMDLDFHGRRDLADEVVITYFETSGDTSMIALIDYYKLYRAFVRGKVESLHMIDSCIDIQEQERVRTKAIRYFRLALGYIERSRLRPTLFITCGLMGSGKSTLAIRLSFELGITSFDSDIVRKKMADISTDTPVFHAYGEGLYTSQVNDSTYAELFRLAETELAAGRSVIIDASFKRKEERSRFAALAKSHTASFAILYVTCNELENRLRLAERAASGQSVSDGRAELLERQQQEFEAPTMEEGLLIPLATTDSSPESLISMIYGRLA